VRYAEAYPFGEVTPIAGGSLVERLPLRRGTMPEPIIMIKERDTLRFSKYVAENPDAPIQDVYIKLALAQQVGDRIQITVEAAK
jgi:hypothetical protein